VRTDDRSTSGSAADTKREDSGSGRPVRTLGRGLEDVSHLFLTATEEKGARVESPATERTPGRPAVRAGVAVLRRGVGLSKDQLTATLVECQDALESGMRALGASVSCSPFGEIDLLALDRCNQLTIVDIETSVGDGLLIRGISHVDWVVRNAANVRRMYQNWPIDCSERPRLILVAPRFSLSLRSALRQLTGPRVTCFRYHPVAIYGGTSILVEPLRDESEPGEAL